LLDALGAFCEGQAILAEGTDAAIHFRGAAAILANRSRTR
jgi:hypothetical protein